MYSNPCIQVEAQNKDFGTVFADKLCNQGWVVQSWVKIT